MVATKEKTSRGNALEDKIDALPTVKGISFDAQSDAPIVEGQKVETPLLSIEEEEGRDDAADGKEAEEEVTEVKEEQKIQEAPVIHIPTFGRAFDMYAKSLALAEESEREGQAKKEAQADSKETALADKAQERSMLEDHEKLESPLKKKKKKGNVFSFLSRAKRETVEIVSESTGPLPKVSRSKSKELEIKKSKSKELEIKKSKSKELEVKKSKSMEMEVKKSESKEVEVNKSKSEEVEVNKSKSKELEVNKSKSKELEVNKSKSTEVLNDIGEAEFTDMMAEIAQSFSEVMKSISEEVPATQPYDEQEHEEKFPIEQKSPDELTGADGNVYKEVRVVEETAKPVDSTNEPKQRSKEEAKAHRSVNRDNQVEDELSWICCF